MHIEDVDPRDDARFAAWFAVARAAEEHERPDEPGWLATEVRRMALDGIGPDPDTAWELLLVCDGGRAVGAGQLELPRRDNLHLAEVLVAVHPAERRRGVGRLLTRELERRAGAAGRDTLLAFGDEPPGPEGPSVARRAALALGWEVSQVEVRRDIDLPLPAERVAQLERDCLPHAADYDVRTWWEHCPDDLLDDRAVLSEQMSTDAPKDQVDWRDEVWDAARVRRNEDLSIAMDRTHVGAGAVHLPTGRMVAFTEMGVPRSDPRRAYQWDTLVSSAHRGHRLGTLLKLATLQALAAASPSTRFVSTWNAQENDAMIRVNDALGARTNGGLAVLQRKLAADQVGQPAGTRSAARPA